MDERKKIIIDYFGTHAETGFKYFKCLENTRKSKKISLNIIKNEIEYYKKHDFKIVLQALNLHLKFYQDKKEQYTRGIIRNIAREENANAGQKITKQGNGVKERDRKLAEALEI